MPAPITHKFNGLMVKMLRQQRDWGTRTLSEMTGLTRRNIQLIERGQIRDPRLSTMMAISQALEIPIEQLIFKVPNK